MDNDVKLQKALARLAEECGETIAAVGKAMRFGVYSTDPTSPLPPSERETNIEYIRREYKDIVASLAEVDRLIAINRLAGEIPAYNPEEDVTSPMVHVGTPLRRRW